MEIGLIIAIERELMAFLEYGTKSEEMIINNRKYIKHLLMITKYMLLNQDVELLIHQVLLNYL